MRRAKVAVARKLAVIMHHVWKEDCDFDWGDAVAQLSPTVMTVQANRKR